MKCSLKTCINGNDWTCRYKDGCKSCYKDCKNYYRCNSCDYYIRTEQEYDAEENCKNCKFCYKLFTPSFMGSSEKHEYCCIVLLDENEVLYLGNNISGLCECFTHR